jgi:hypothetical protein
MKHKLHIPFVNREDLLRDAVESVREIGNIHIWADGVPCPVIPDATLHELPPIPFTAVQNFFIQSSWDDDIMFFMHNDGLAAVGAAQRLLKQALLQQDEKWGVMFTHYDVLCAFNMRAVRAVGYWDTMFFQYTADTDYYHMLRAAGWPSLDIGGHDVEHRNNASSTLKADPLFNHRTQFRAGDAFDHRYYKMKWGGVAGEETFTKPFQDFLDPDSLKPPPRKGQRA